MIMENKKLGKGVKFERIRRITGYLVGTLDKWNDAKKAEEKDRVKHGVEKDGK
jgi:ribonucleoside-triphosphate reductase